jgi:hypothetical protein
MDSERQIGLQRTARGLLAWCSVDCEFLPIRLQHACIRSANETTDLRKSTGVGPKLRPRNVVLLGRPESKRPQDPTGDEKPTEGLRKRKQDFSTPYAPSVLTLRGPSAAIPLG